MVPNSNDIVNQARVYMGTPWRHQGRNPATGLDCLGLVARVMMDLDIPLRDNLSYSRQPDPKQMLAGLLDHGIEIPKDQATPGCVYWMSFAKNPQHVGIATDVGVIHCYNQLNGQVIEHVVDKKWQRRIVKAFRLKGVFYE